MGVKCSVCVCVCENVLFVIRISFLFSSTKKKSTRSTERRMSPYSHSPISICISLFLSLWHFGAEWIDHLSVSAVIVPSEKGSPATFFLVTFPPDSCFCAPAKVGTFRSRLDLTLFFLFVVLLRWDPRGCHGCRLLLCVRFLWRVCGPWCPSPNSKVHTRSLLSLALFTTTSELHK